MHRNLCSDRLLNKIGRKRKERSVHRPCYGTEKKMWNIKVKVIPILIGDLDIISKAMFPRTGATGNERISEDHSDYTIIKIGQITKRVMVT